MKITPKTVLAGAGAMLAAAIAGIVMLTSGNVVNVAPGGNVQAAINSAECGGTIVLEAGAVYTVNLTLPVKACADGSYITIQSSRANELPEGKRVSPAQAPLFAWLQSNVNAEPVIKTAAGAHHYKFVGIRTSTANENVVVFDIVRLGEGRQTQNTLASVPNNLIIDRSYIHGWPTQDSQRGIGLNSADTTISNSYISDIHTVGIEAQAIGGWNGTKNAKIINNYLEGAGQGIMFGGADSARPSDNPDPSALVPSDIEIRRNHLFKPHSWRVGDPSYAGKHWTVKNILELKSARRVTIDGNVFENIWVDGQDGSAILFTVRNQECTAPWSVVEDVTYTNNTTLNAQGAGLNLLGMDNEATPEYIAANPSKCSNVKPEDKKLGSGQGARVKVSNNVFDKIKGTFLQMNGFNDVTIENNTHLQGFNTILFFGKQQSQRFIYRNNVTQEKEFGIRDETGTEGMAALEKMAPGYVFAKNVMATPYTKNPPDNDYPPALVIGSDYRTPYAGKGANIDAILAAQAGAATPTPSPSVSPSVSPVVPSPSPTSTAPLPSPSTSLPSPSPVVSPSPKPSPSASPSPSPSPRLPNCTANQIIGNPARCLCQTGVRCTGNNARCQ